MASCQVNRSSWLPVAFSIFVSTGVVVAFILHYVRDEVYNFPQISQAAGNPPQSGIFCIFLFLAAFFGVASMLLRFASVHDMNHSSNRLVDAINVMAVLVGLIGLIGMILVAAYPLSPIPQTEPHDWFQVAIKPHRLASQMLFISVTLYYVLQTTLTVIHWRKEGLVICWIRALVVVLTIAAYIVMRYTPHPECEDCPRRNGTLITVACDEARWKYLQENRTIEVDGYFLNVTSSEIEFCKAIDRAADTIAISELVLVILLVTYILTFCKEFHHISISASMKNKEMHYEESPTQMSATTPL